MIGVYHCRFILYLYLGKIEVGSDKSAEDKMKITGYSVSCGVGNGWDSVIVPSADKNLVAYVVNFYTFLDAKTRTTMKSDYSRKISYYTPKFTLNKNNSLQFGISYIPDTSNSGHGEIYANEMHTPIGSKQIQICFKGWCKLMV